jgi:hypothetical protein
VYVGSWLPTFRDGLSNLLFKVQTVKQATQHPRRATTSTSPRWKPEISPKEIISLNKINGCEPVYLTTLSITKIIQRQRQINEELRTTGGMMLTGENRSPRRKPYTSVTLSTVNLTWIWSGIESGPPR